VPQSDAVTRRSALAVATLASFLTPFMSSSLNVALPAIGGEFGMDAVTLSWIPTSYLLAAAMFLVPFGKLADIHGRKRIFSAGVLTYTVASVVCAIAGTDAMLIAGRVLQGIGGAMMMGIGVAILTAVFPAGERGRVLGINSSAVYIGLSVGPFVGGLLTGLFGWHAVFLVNVPLGLLMLLVTRGVKGEWAEGSEAKLDIPGSILYSVSLTAVMYGFSRLPDADGVVLLAGGLLGMAGFLWLESHTAHPLLDMALFRHNRVFALSNLAALINYSATFAVGFLLSLYLQYVKGLSAREAGLILIAQPLVMALCSPYAGRLSDRVEPRIVASSGMGLIVVGLTVLAFLSEATPEGVIIGSLLVLGLGFALFASPNTNAVMSSVDKSRYGVASGTLATMRLTGQMLSIGVAMLMFALFLGRVQVTEATTELFLVSVRAAFALFAGLCLLGVFASLARGTVRGLS
jgi:EmrB/QacA subfamily drug resistance transporter